MARTKKAQVVPAPSGEVVHEDDEQGIQDALALQNNGESAVRMRRAFELRKAGLTYDEIARRVGYADGTGAYRAVKRILERSETESVKEMRQLHEARLNEILMVSYSNALKGDVAAARLTLDIMERQSALHGLDTPVVSEIQRDVIILGGDSDEFVTAIQAALKKQELGTGAIDAESWEDE